MCACEGTASPTSVCVTVLDLGFHLSEPVFALGPNPFMIVGRDLSACGADLSTSMNCTGHVFGTGMNSF